MYPAEDEIKALNLNSEHLALFTTPFKDLTKEGAVAAFHLGDALFKHRQEEKQKAKDAEAAKSEEERIAKLRDDMTSFHNPTPKKFY